MSDTSGSIPAGWYPDPSGARQWRVWNGTAWSNVTRAYAPLATGASASAPSAATQLGVAELETLSALRRLKHFGIVAYYVGFALVVGLVDHWPGHARAISLRLASPLLGVAVGLSVIGYVSFAAAVRGLRGRWSLDAVVPVVNTFAASLVMSTRLGVVNNTFRLLVDALVTAGYVLASRTNPWFGVFLASVAAYQYLRCSLLIDAMIAGSDRRDLAS